MQRPIKRLFTPEIKRMLKEWLIRRRENPYPSREEKKELAVEAGLTYTQICNWFANWRRKLKNSSKERNKKTWGNLIKNYNTSAKGNVEQFSISSDDSIWGELEDCRTAALPDATALEQVKQKKIARNQDRNRAYFKGVPMYEHYYVLRGASNACSSEVTSFIHCNDYTISEFCFSFQTRMKRKQKNFQKIIYLLTQNLRIK